MDEMIVVFPIAFVLGSRDGAEGSVITTIEGFLHIVGLRPRFAHASGNEQPDVSVLEVILPQSFKYGLNYFFFPHRNCESDVVCRFVEPIDMFLQFEDDPVVSSNTLEDAVAVEETMIENRNRGF